MPRRRFNARHFLLGWHNLANSIMLGFDISARGGPFLWLLAGLGFLTLHKSYVVLYGEAPYVAPILRPSRLEFTVSSGERQQALANATKVHFNASSPSLTSNATYAPPELEFTLTSDDLAASRSANSIDDLVISDNSRDHRLPWCNRDQLRTGSWVVDRRDKPLYVTPTKHLRCYPAEKFSESPWVNWRWLPADKKTRKCDYQSWSQEDFCSLLPRATVAIIGDSLSWEHYSSLVQTLGLKTHQGYQHQSKYLNSNIVQSACHGQTKILYRRDDRLHNLTSALEQHFPTVMILNRGAHYAPDAKLLPALRENIRAVREWLSQCDTKKIRCHFFWRTTVPGHPHCGNFTRPVNNKAAMEAHVENLSNYDEYTMKFHWYDFRRQNEAVVEEFRRAKLNSFEVIDAYDFNILRPDEHRAHQGDCLHSCYPGKMDVFNDMVLHYLRMQRTDIDIERLIHVAEREGWSVSENTKYDVDATEEARFFVEGHRDYQRLFRDRPGDN